MIRLRRLRPALLLLLAGGLLAAHPHLDGGLPPLRKPLGEAFRWASARAFVAADVVDPPSVVASPIDSGGIQTISISIKPLLDGKQGTVASLPLSTTGGALALAAGPDEPERTKATVANSRIGSGTDTVTVSPPMVTILGAPPSGKPAKITIGANPGKPDPPALVGDGEADDTAAIQALVDAASRPGLSGRVVLPSGTYRTTAPIVYRGGFDGAIRISGEVVSAAMGGAYLRYDGPPGPSAVLEIAGGVDVTIEHLGLDTGSGAQYGLYAHHDPARNAGVNHLTLDRLIVGGRDNRAGSACLSIGVGFDGKPDTHQADDVQVRSCKLVQGEKGIVTGIANVKNFFITQTALWFAKYGLDYGVGAAGSGVCVVRDCNFLQNATADVRMGVGSLTLDGCQSEGSGAFLVNYGASKNPANARIVGCDWHSGNTKDGDVVVKFQGTLGLHGNQFEVDRTDRSIPRFQLDLAEGGVASLDSSGNWFGRAASDYTDGRRSPVFVDGGGADLFKNPSRAAWLRCWGDSGGTPGAMVRLRPR